jgi:hypothetical protein
MSFPCHIVPEFIGVAPATLQAWLTASQQALQDLSIGGKPVTLSYAQGDGTKSVTYTPAQISLLEQRCRNLARALGLVGPRRAIGVRF